MPYLAIFAIVLAFLLYKHPLPLKGLILSLKAIHDREMEDVPTYAIECLTVIYAGCMIWWMIGGGKW